MESPQSSSTSSSAAARIATSSGGGSSASAADWWQAARPHTWPNAFAPVIAGLGAAAAITGGVDLVRAVLALVVALALIIGVNFANDYSDGIRGTDGADRTGPGRLVGSGKAAPGAVRNAAFVAFGVAGVAGFLLSAITSFWLVLIGLCCVAAAWGYTGGKNPYGYRGFGEFAVFVFFGLVAVLGTEFTQAHTLSWAGVALATTVGAMSASVNLVNNLRDIPTDAASGKITLAVRLGDARTRLLYVAFQVIAYVGVVVAASQHGVGVLAAFAALPVSFAAALPVVRGAKGKALIPVLGLTGKAMLGVAVIAAIALYLS
ncbi:1,4-dihydroxy-2-naphthoate polyprenyltransferase [Corynebacterium choanae]|nr:1,4-dihydroxy-2-naphthoate polyprenyltransferase [Corynebacterium choanae]